jgi:hypothetical protein
MAGGMAALRLYYDKFHRLPIGQLFRAMCLGEYLLTRAIMA